MIINIKAKKEVEYFALFPFFVFDSSNNVDHTFKLYSIGKNDG